MISRRGFCTAGKRRERVGRSYQDRHRSSEQARPGWRTAGFSTGRGHEAYDAELSAMIYGLVHILGRGTTDRAYTIYPDSTAAMRRVVNDAPRPGQELAIKVIELAQHVVDQGNSIAIWWTPAHREVEGNERADQAAREMASPPPLRATRRCFSLAFLRRRASDRATRAWGEDIERRNSGRRAFRLPTATL